MSEAAGGVSGERGSEAFDGNDDPVTRNRATPRRHVPGRDPTGWPVTRRWVYLTAAVVAAATLVLLAVLLTG